jgi:hypothetical protein
VGRARREARLAAAGLILAAGAVHLYLWFDYFHRVHVVGALFLVNAASAAAIAAWLFGSDGVLAVLAGLAYAGGTLVFFTISVTAGLFGYHESLFGTWQVTAAAIEAVAIVALLASNRLRLPHVVASSRGEPTTGD